MEETDIYISEDYLYKEETYYRVHFHDITGLTLEEAKKIKEEILGYPEKIKLLQQELLLAKGIMNHQEDYIKELVVKLKSSNPNTYKVETTQEEKRT